MKYYTDIKIKTRIDSLLEQNAKYQAENNCCTNSKSRIKEINRFCNRQFLHPIKMMDREFYETIKLQND